MGCSSSRDVRVGGAPAPAPAAAERRQSLRSRSVSRAASALSSLAFCRGRLRDDAVHAYSTLPLQEPPPSPAKVAASGGDAAAATTTFAPVNASPGLKAALDAAPAPVTRRCASCNASSPPPPPPPPAATTAPAVEDLCGFDEAIMSGLRDIVVDPSPSHPALLFPEHENPTTPTAPPPPFAAGENDDGGDKSTPAARDIPEVTGLVRARVNDFHAEIAEKKNAFAAANDAATPPPPTTPRRVVVVYYTSIRGVRRTFEDGRAVRAILRCHRVRVDERDVSMHAAFKSELRDLLAGGGAPPLPRVFLDGRHDLGGAEEVRAMHEAGELAKILAGCDAVTGGACAACGEMRFLPCETCHGSCKVFAGEEGMFFRRCPDCNENGLIRCPVCCY
uniref:Glutaredoxin domain-containing protein n=1 Tax=Leersia perrieri TaxID=77586 RepID=A0A0D9X4U6_9ORYZ